MREALRPLPVISQMEGMCGSIVTGLFDLELRNWMRF